MANVIWFNLVHNITRKNANTMIAIVACIISKPHENPFNSVQGVSCMCHMRKQARATKPNQVVSTWEKWCRCSQTIQWITLEQ